MITKKFIAVAIGAFQNPGARACQTQSPIFKNFFPDSFSCEEESRGNHIRTTTKQESRVDTESLGKFPNTIIFIVNVDAADVNSKFWKNIIIRSIDLSGRKNKKRWIS